MSEGKSQPTIDGRLIFNRGCWFLWGMVASSLFAEVGAAKSIGLTVLGGSALLILAAITWEIVHNR